MQTSCRDRLSSDYSGNMSDATTCSCMVNSVEKCSVRSCGSSSMFQEPFFLHPPGSRPRDGLYINPMSAPYPASRPSKEQSQITNSSPPPPSTNGNGNHSGDSFYLHSPRDLVYTRISHLFEDTQQQQQPGISGNTSRASSDRKDEMLTVKVDVHINNNNNNNGTLKPHPPSSPIAPVPPPPPPPPPLPTTTTIVNGNGNSTKDSGSEHAYEQIFIKPEDSPKHAPLARRKITDNGCTTDVRSNKTDRRYSRSSTASESSNMSSEVHCYSSATSTPSLSRNSSNERRSKSPKDNLIERKNSSTSSTRTESEKETKTSINGVASIFRPPPPPPPPPPEIEEVVIVTSKVVESSSSFKEERKDGCLTSSTQEQKCESTITISASTSTSLAEEQQLVSSSPAASSHQQIAAATTEIQTVTSSSSSSTSHQVTAHLVNRHMVLPFIPPKFANQAADSDTLLKPSEYLRSICKGAVSSGNTSSLAKARSVDNLDIRSVEEENGKNHDSSEEEEEEEEEDEESENTERNIASGPPPPPLPPPPMNGGLSCILQQQQPTSTTSSGGSSTVDGEISKQSQQQQQPLATISIQDLTSVQLRRTNIKMHATKTFSAPPNRSVSMTNVSEAFCVQKTDLIAELKKTRDIPGIKKLKVQRAQVEKTQEQTMISEINKAFSIDKFVEQIPEKDSSGNVIPIWKRQMLARKAAERAKKELEKQIARENEEKRIQSIPPWKRQLLAKKDSDFKTPGAIPLQTCLATTPPKVEVPKKEPVVVEAPPPPLPTTPIPPPAPPKIEEPEIIVHHEEKRRSSVVEESDSVHIIPWRAQLRKTNSKLNILD